MAGLLAPLVLMAADGPFSVATIDLRDAILQTREGSRLVQHLKDRQARQEQSLQKERAEIVALRERLAEGREIMSVDAQSELAFTIDRKTKQLERDAEDARLDLSQRQTDLARKLRGRILALLPDYAAQHGYTLVIDVSAPSSGAVFAANAVDITVNIVRLYDQAHPVNDGANTITRNNAEKAGSSAPR